MIGGREVDVTGLFTGLVSWFAQNATDQEKPVGDWNTLDLYVLGDRAIHVVNGVPVLEAWNICNVEHIFGHCEPLAHGRIQLQAEGSETLFRHDQVAAEGDADALALQLPICFKVRALSGGLVSSTPE